MSKTHDRKQGIMNDDNGRKQQIEARLRELHDVFKAKLPDKLREIGAAWQSCMHEPAVRAHWVTLHRLLHTLAGSSGSFGFMELGMQLRGMEKEINAHLASDLHQPMSAMADLDKRLLQLLDRPD